MRKAILLAVALPFLVMSLTATILSSDYSVIGVVTDAKGSTVRNASVTAIPAEEGMSASGIGWVHTDTNGGFRLVLKPGRYLIRAKDETDGYPDPNFLLCSDPSAKFPQVSVEDSDVLSVRVILGTKGGVLEGDLRDSSTQRPLPKGKVTIRDAQNPNVFVEIFADKMGHFRFTVPNKDLHVLAAAVGYKTTQYVESERLILSGGERRSIAIDLEAQ
jgi:hypothetical protein